MLGMEDWSGVAVSSEGTVAFEFSISGGEWMALIFCNGSDACAFSV